MWHVYDTCVWEGVVGHVHRVIVWRSEDDFFSPETVPSFNWDSGVELRFPSFHGRHFHALTHLISSLFISFCSLDHLAT